MRHSSVGGGCLSYEQLPLSVPPNNDHSELPDTIFSRKKFENLYLSNIVNLYYISSLNIRGRFIILGLENDDYPYCQTIGT